MKEVVSASLPSRIKTDVIRLMKVNGRVDLEDISGVVYDMVCTPESEKEAENADSMEEWKNALIYSENSFVADFDEMVQNRIVECILREQIVRYDRPGEYLETWHRYLKGEVV